MTASDAILTEACARLLATAPGLEWWPGTPWSVAISAVLVQQTTWVQASRAVDRLADAARDPARLRALPTEELGARIRCCGFWRRKALTLRALADIWDDLAADARSRRARLLAVAGIGPETADAICCYAFGEPVLVVDAMTARLTTRLTGETVTTRHYDDLQRRWMAAASHTDNLICRRLHAAIVEHARTVCRLRGPRCEDCALHSICAYGNSMPSAASQ